MTPTAATPAAFEAAVVRRGAPVQAAALRGPPANPPPNGGGASRGQKADPGDHASSGGDGNDGSGRPDTPGSRGGRTAGNIRQKKGMGQHFLVSKGVAERIVSAAGIRDGEAVFELGTGRGILTGLLCKRAARVVSVELDRELADETRTTLSEFGNLRVVRGDGLGPAAKVGDTADGRSTVSASDCAVFVSNLPYSRSRRAVEQLASSGFERCIIMVQKEFASKLLAGASPRGEKGHRSGDGCGGPRASGRRRAISVVAQYCFEIRAIMDVPASCFEPRPWVDSVVLAMARRRTLEGARIAMINRIFSYRRKRISTLVGMICGGSSGGGDGARDHNRHGSNHNDHIVDADSHPPGRRMHADGTRGEVRGGSDRLRLDDLSVQDVVDLADSVLARV